jgi:hypothetical protein
MLRKFTQLVKGWQNLTQIGDGGGAGPKQQHAGCCLQLDLPTSSVLPLPLWAIEWAAEGRGELTSGLNARASLSLGNDLKLMCEALCDQPAGCP